MARNVVLCTTKNVCTLTLALKIRITLRIQYVNATVQLHVPSSVQQSDLFHFSTTSIYNYEPFKAYRLHDAPSL